MSSKLEFYKKEACMEAMKSPMNKRIGAIMVCRNKIISRGHNYYNISTVLNTNIYMFSTHAEIDCIRKSRGLVKSKDSIVIYIIRVDKNGLIIPITPCKNCQKALDKNFFKCIPIC
jgi:tRNA(Arg) A34 adenosine deaminase TadA